MLSLLAKFLCSFESCFSRKAMFHWLVTTTLGLMLRSNKLGVTSVIRGLAYKENGLSVLIRDGVKHSKESRCIPGVKKLFQESENSAKAAVYPCHICFSAYGERAPFTYNTNNSESTRGRIRVSYRFAGFLNMELLTLKYS